MRQVRAKVQKMSNWPALRFQSEFLRGRQAPGTAAKGLESRAPTPPLRKTQWRHLPTRAPPGASSFHRRGSAVPAAGSRTAARGPRPSPRPPKASASAGAGTPWVRRGSPRSGAFRGPGAPGPAGPAAGAAPGSPRPGLTPRACSSDCRPGPCPRAQLPGVWEAHISGKYGCNHHRRVHRPYQAGTERGEALGTMTGSAQKRLAHACTTHPGASKGKALEDTGRLALN